jgi:alpha-ketoglutarate-dependent taurine dioxygenase
MEFASWKNEQRGTPAAAKRAITERGWQDGGAALPLTYKALVPDLDLARWYGLHAEQLEQELLEHGAILLRGFDVRSEACFKNFAGAAIRIQAAYVQGATPRTKLQPGVYTSTEFSAEHEIQLHNELSYVLEPPRKIAFCCLTPARQGGQTQIVDVNAVYNNLDPAIVQAFEARGGWMLKRNYHQGFGPTVFASFVLDSIEEIRRYCEREQVELCELSERHVMTRQVRAAVRTHPETGMKLWMNHAAFWHPDNLTPEVRARLGEMFSDDDLPYSTYFGDGTPIDSATMRAIGEAYRTAEVQFDWKRGDVLLLDNWRVAHGRKPFSGERKVIVSMGA